MILAEYLSKHHVPDDHTTDLIPISFFAFLDFYTIRDLTPMILAWDLRLRWPKKWLPKCMELIRL